MTGKTGVLCGCAVLVLASSSHAYIGPGIGVTMIGWAVGAAAVMGAALWAVILLPVRMFLKKRKLSGKARQNTESRDRADSSRN